MGCIQRLGLGEPGLGTGWGLTVKSQTKTADLRCAVAHPVEWIKPMDVHTVQGHVILTGHLMPWVKRGSLVAGVLLSCRGQLLLISCVGLGSA